MSVKNHASQLTNGEVMANNKLCDTVYSHETATLFYNSSMSQILQLLQCISKSAVLS